MGDESLRTIFNEAIEIADAAERERFLHKACGADARLQERLKKLLQAHDEAGGFLSNPDQPAGPTLRKTMVLALPPEEKPGEKIGHYKILQQIGEGGCGVVYMAEQEKPIRRRVALKVIKLGMDTRQVVARFEAERQALALLDHPNIAKVLDAGATESGRPYFVMELVRGVKITEFCDQQKLSPHERLKLFMQVCSAVQHAHQKGIIHRDLKPSNILVTMVDGAPVPKVIDFGIAKATNNQPLTDKTVFTAFEQFIGTPAYMSPEQAQMSGVDIDTRTDIYSLGVVLYELLTGATPFDAAKLLKAGLDEIRRIVREEEPAKPSTRLQTLAQGDLTTVAAARQTEAPKLIHLVRGDLDWVVMKCLEKDRNRRYATANGLAADIQRHLQNEPVVARPPSNLYRFEKMVRRNWLAFAAAAAVLLALLLGIAASTWQAIRATHAEREQSRLRQEAQANAQRAESESAKSKQVAAFLQEMLKGVGPSVALGRDTTMLREILDKTAIHVGKDLTNQPDVEAELRETLGDVYLAIGFRTEAAAMQRRALEIRQSYYGAHSPEAARSMERVALAIFDPVKSQPIKLAADFQTLNEAIELERQSLEIRTNYFEGDSAEIADSLSNLGTMLREKPDLPEAADLQRRSLAMRERLFGKGSLETTGPLQELALVLSDQNKPAEATNLLDQAIDIRRRLDKGPTVELGILLHELGWVLRKAHRGPSPENPAPDPVADEGYQRGEICFREALGLWRKVLDPNHPLMESTLSSLGDMLFNEGQSLFLNHSDKPAAAVKYTEAIAAYREAVQIRRKLYGEQSIKVASSLANLAYVLWGLALTDSQQWGKISEAEQTIRESLTVREVLAGEIGQGAAQTNEIIEVVRCELGEILIDEDKRPEAFQTFATAAEHGSLRAQGKLGEFYAKGYGVAQDDIVARKWYLRAAEGGNVQAQMDLGKLCARPGSPAWNPAEAEKWLVKAAEHEWPFPLDALAWFRATCTDPKFRDGARAVELSEKSVAMTHRKDAAMLGTLAAAYVEAGKFDQAIAVQKEAIDLLHDESAKLGYASRLKLYENQKPYRDQ